jgi:transposase
MYYSGIDLHKDMSFITTIDDSGVIVKQSKLPNAEYAILNYFFSQGSDHKAVVESTSNWYWLSDLLKDHGIELVLAHAKYLKAISYAKVKTDKIDSQTLAQLLRMNLIPTAHQISPEKRGLRDMMRARLRLVHKNTSCLNSIHRLMEKFNLSIPDNRPLHDLSTMDLLTDLPFDSEYKFQLDILIEQVILLNRQIKALEKSLHPQLIPNPDIQRLLHVPGIGKVLSFNIYLEIDGIERFPDVSQFYSYCRLVPGADNSNRNHRHKSGNKDGNKYLKMAFTEAGFRATLHYKEIKQFYQSKSRKKHKTIARILVAKELAKICYFMLKEKREFNNTFKSVKISKVKSKQWPRLANPAA